LYDGNENLDIHGFYEKYPELKDVEILLGDLTEEQMKRFDILVLSPGIPTEIPMVDAMRKLGATVWGEVELAYAFSKGKVLAITGTNGKTTTTSLLGEIMRSSFSDVKVVGNIGIPYTSVALETTEETVTVAEISSFQLETIENFAPKVTAILNITPDHLNRHHTMENYTAVKESITKNQGRDGICVLNYEDEVLRKFGENLPLKVIYFSSRRELAEGLFYKDECIYLAQEGKVTKILPVRELNLLGRHNYENVMAATAMALGFGVDLEKIKKVLCNFQAVEHRIEYVTEKRGVKFYNDSKGTNPDAAIQGIRAMVRPTFLIGGGYDKQSAYGEWIDAFEGKVKELVLIGQTREAIAETAREHGFTDIILKDTLKEAVELCYAHAESGDAVLLSPACASWGMFTDYEERGRVFKEIVNNLKE
ncbi:MAG: UDP-N-acetylmuramoyl-L-alanine--D-glutamate ligase, partial [Lachnospiraceae bacterium]|nr:UDP-N-acetylmuramoyl-L-alanine--D-glutamate ligase [Lachnospiraceae bacterium]